MGLNGHRELVEQYRLDCETWDREAEKATMNYSTELGEYAAEHPRPVFKTYLMHRDKAS